MYIYTRMLATYLQEWLQTQCDAIHIHVVLYGVWASCFLSSTWCTVIKPCKLMSRELITTSTDIQPSHTAIPGLTFCMNLVVGHSRTLTKLCLMSWKQIRNDLIDWGYMPLPGFCFCCLCFKLYLGSLMLSPWSRQVTARYLHSPIVMDSEIHGCWHSAASTWGT